ncbi:MAG TPA: hypothetical protein VMU03_15320, partial [Gammaproteobacteria bacterium]|nr:hypothetical protein [Gammaproteobacteria bacterium]
MLIADTARTTLAVFALATLAACGQRGEPSSAPAAAAPSGGGYKVPRTPWGDPDLQGKWPGTHLVGVPVQRDEK